MVNLWDHFCEYADGCTIHGIKYLAEGKRHWYEKFCWIMVFVISITCCSKLMLDIWNKWNDFPVIVSIDNNPTPVWSVPFPAVTICPQTKTDPNKLNFTAAYGEIFSKPQSNNFSTGELKQLKKLQGILHTCDYSVFGLQVDDLKFDDLITGIDVVKYINALRPTFYGTPLVDMAWKGLPVLPQKILTNVGLCYTFNVLNQKEIFRVDEIQQNYTYITKNENKRQNYSTDWTLEKGYKEDKLKKILESSHYPYRAFTAHKKDSLRISSIIPENFLDYSCAGAVQGFKIMFHSPSDIPQFNRNFYNVPLNNLITFRIRPKVSRTSDTVKKLKPQERNCYYNDEKYLQFFNVYSQQNCELECLANFTLERCGCVKFSMPSIPGTPICGTKSIKCYMEVEYSVTKTEKMLEINNKNYCSCLPSCSTIVYETKKLHIDIDVFKYFTANNPNSEEVFSSNTLNISLININFDDMEFIGSTRTAIYNFSDFLANCGGLLGLFMGISLLSVIEVTYFFTIRLICNEELTKKEKGKEEEDAYPEYIEDDNNMEMMPSQKIDME